MDAPSGGELWVDKYRPRTLDDYILAPDIKDYFRNMVKCGNMQNMCLEGCPGSGKTSLIRVLINELKAESLFIKCATEGNIDVLRSKVEPFCNAMTIDGRLKVVLLDEVDAASGTTGNGSGFQSGLRTLIEAAQSDTRFALACNYVSKVIPAVLSRCPVIPLRFDRKDLLQRVKFILDSEKVKYCRDSLKAFIEESFSYYPDVRRIINYLQLCSNSGELVVRLGKAADAGKDAFLEELMRRTMSEPNLIDVRKFYLGNKDKIPDFVAFGSDVYNAAVDGDMVTEDGVLRLTDQLYQLNEVIDKEAGLFGMLTAVRRFRRKA